MSKFSVTSKGKNITYNKSGSLAYKMNHREKLATQVLTTFFNEKKYYGDNSREIVESIRANIYENPEFVAKLAAYARNEMHLRSISHVIVAELAVNPKGKKFTRAALNSVCIRPDDLIEIFAYYINTFGKPIPNSLKKGAVDVLKKFDEYQLAKYNRKTDVRFKDIISMTHPKPDSKDRENLWKRVLEDRLEIPVTWETELSKNGNNKESWEKLIDSNKLGYMAMLRNLRNILTAEISDEHINKVLTLLSSKDRVLKSRQLPFRFYSAYKTLKNYNLLSSRIVEALEEAIRYSVSNMQKIPGKTLIVSDVSGSMQCSISNNSFIEYIDIAMLLTSLSSLICEDSVSMAVDTKLYPLNLSKYSGVLQTTESFLNKFCGYGTHLNLPFEHIIKNEMKFDRIIMFSDNEINSEFSRTSTLQCLVSKYRENINKNLWVHGIDMVGYGTKNFIGEKTNIVAGWSEKVIDFIMLKERGVTDLINRISGYKI